MVNVPTELRDALIFLVLLLIQYGLARSCGYSSKQVYRTGWYYAHAGRVWYNLSFIFPLMWFLAYSGTTVATFLVLRAAGVPGLDKGLLLSVAFLHFALFYCGQMYFKRFAGSRAYFNSSDPYELGSNPQTGTFINYTSAKYGSYVGYPGPLGAMFTAWFHTLIAAALFILSAFIAFRVDDDPAGNNSVQTGQQWGAFALYLFLLLWSIVGSILSTVFYTRVYRNRQQTTLQLDGDVTEKLARSWVYGSGEKASGSGRGSSAQAMLRRGIRNGGARRQRMHSFF